MKNLFSIAAIAAVMLDGAGVAAAELPTFELSGLPITPHQVAVVGSAYVEERPAVPTLILGGMPASPHQVDVLMPRRKITEAATAAGLTEARSSLP